MRTSGSTGLAFPWAAACWLPLDTRAARFQLAAGPPLPGASHTACSSLPSYLPGPAGLGLCPPSEVLSPGPNTFSLGLGPAPALPAPAPVPPPLCVPGVACWSGSDPRLAGTRPHRDVLGLSGLPVRLQFPTLLCSCTLDWGPPSLPPWVRSLIQL